jgi:hypothetical protein
MANSVLQITADPQFQQAPISVQKALLAGADASLGKLSDAAFTSFVQDAQRTALKRPDLLAPPSGATNSKYEVRPVMPSGERAGSLQATPDEATPAGHAAAITQREDTSNLGTVGNAVAQTGIGIAKGAGDKIEGTVGKLIPGEAPTSKELESTNGYQTTGKVLEGMAEFATGDEALKGLSEVERVRKLLPTMKLLEESPKLQQALSTAMRSGVVSATQDLTHGASLKEAAESGLTTGVLTGGISGLNSVVDTNTKWLQKGLDTLAARQDIDPNVFKMANALLSAPEANVNASKELAAGLLTPKVVLDSEGKSVAKAMVPLAASVGWKLTKGIGSVLLIDRTLDAMGVSNEARHIVDAAVGTGALLHHSSKMAAILGSPEANELRGKIAAFVIRHPAVMDAAKVAIKGIISQASQSAWGTQFDGVPAQQ